MEPHHSLIFSLSAYLYSINIYILQAFLKIVCFSGKNFNFNYTSAKVVLSYVC